MRKALLMIALAILVLTPIAAYAIMANSPVRSSVSQTAYRQELTQQQSADLQESYQQMIDLRKETITKMVQDGLLTEEQGEQALERLDDMAAYHAQNGYTYGFGMMGGCRSGLDADDDFYGRGRMRGYNWNY